MPWVDPDRHGWVQHLADDNDWNSLVAEYGGQLPDPFRQIVRAVRAGGCQTVVIENRYVDVDYRSDYSAFWSLKFENKPAFARRLHFFKGKLDDAKIHRIDGGDYLGYSVSRPVDYGRVGRTVLTPPPEMARATLATVREEINLFGNPLVVEGVPFCQQDAQYLRCAHAAAWICHYVACRRNLVGRRSTAEIVDLSPSMLSPERALPSRGMTLNQLQAVFGSLDQPALFYGLSNMPQVPGVENPTPQQDAAGKDLPAGYWDTRMISVICRYLNSGFPVLIGARDHAFILVGWLRDGGDVKFVGCDDQQGPYEIIDSPFNHYKTPWDSIMIPLPPKVFLSAEVAEARAHQLFTAVAKSHPAVKSLSHLGDGLKSGEVELRTMLKEGRVFKRDVEAQTSSEQVLRDLRLARLPHWVWVVEAHETAKCHSEPCVHATAVFDSTSYDLSPQLDVLTVPGIVAVYPPDEGKPVVSPGSVEPWQSMLTVH